MAQTKQSKGKSRRGWIIGAVVVVVLAGAAVAFGPRLLSLAGMGRGQAQANALKTAPVTTITAVTSVTSAGPVMAVQSGAVFWKTTGTVAAVNVKPGDHVQGGRPADGPGPAQRAAES